MDKKLLILFVIVLTLVSVPSTSAWFSLSDYKNYIAPTESAKYGSYDIYIGHLIGSDEKVAKYTLTDNTDLCNEGNCEAIGITTLYQEGRLFDEVIFEHGTVNNPKYYISNKQEEYLADVPIFKETCRIIPANFTGDKDIEQCNNFIIGWEKKTLTRDIWEKYNNKIVSTGDYKWKITGQISKSVDWILSVDNQRLQNWAWWNVSAGGNAMNFTAIPTLLTVKFDNDTSGNITLYNDDLVLMYNMNNLSSLGETDSKVVDISKQSQNATMVNAPRWNSTVKKFGEGSYKFGIANNYINVATTPFNVSRPWTISTWSYFDTSATNGAPFAGGADMTMGLIAYISTTKLSLFLDDNGVGWSIASNVAGTINLPVQKWTHIVLRWNGTTYNTFINGVRDINLASTTPVAEMQGLHIGNWGDGTSYPLNGLDDEFRAYNKSLSDDEIQQVYQTNLNKFNPTDWGFYANYTSGTLCYSNGTETCEPIIPLTYGMTLSTTLISPINYYNTTQLTNIFQSNATAQYENITNATLYVWNGGTSINSTIGLSGTFNSTNITFTKTDGTYIWNIRYCATNATDYLCSFASSNRTYTIDTVAPIVTIIKPNSTYIVKNPSENISLNYSITELHPYNCWFNTSYNATKIFFTNCQTNGTLLYPITNPDSLTIFVYANDTVNNIGYSSVTINKDTTSPTFTLNMLNNISTISLPTNATFNVTISDINLQNCSYSTSDNATKTYYTCNTNQTILFQTGGVKTINVSANDTFGNVNSTVYSFNIYDFNVTQTGATSAGEGTSQIFTLLVNSTSFAIGNADANLWYNGINRGTSTKSVLDTNSIYFTKTLIIPSGAGNETGKAVNWLWNYNATQLSTRNTTTQTQTVYNISIDDCSGLGHVILNMSLRDEETNTPINRTAGATVEIDLNITSWLNNSQSWNYHNIWLNNNTDYEYETYAVCVPNELLNSTSYKIDFVIGFDSTNRVREFYYLENGTLDNTNYFNSYTDNTIDLMDLLTADSTTFLFKFTDFDGLEIDNALIHTYRKYIGEGLFREVERSKQDTNGETHVHLVEEDVIYYFMITQLGRIIYTSDTYNAKCLSTPCEISLSASPSQTNWSIIDNEGGQYSVSTSRTTRTVTTKFELDSPTLVNVSIYRFYNGVEELVNTSSLTATAGSVPLYVPLSYNNATFFVVIYNNNSFVKSEWVTLTEGANDYFGTFGAILGGLIVLSMMLMAVAEGIGFIIFTILALILIGVMQLTDLGWLALISIICAGGIIIFKLIGRRNNTG